MKILVIGLDHAVPELLFDDEELVNIRRLMEFGIYGCLESNILPDPQLAWLSLSLSQDLGALGVHTSEKWVESSNAIQEDVGVNPAIPLAIWEQIALEGRRSIIVDFPLTFPQREFDNNKVLYISTNGQAQNASISATSAIAEEIHHLDSNLDVDVAKVATDDSDGLVSQIYASTRTHFQAIRDLLQSQEWDYFQFIELGLAQIQQHFGQDHDGEHSVYEPNSPYFEVIRSYHRYLDGEIGSLFEYLDDETGVVIVSACGAQHFVDSSGEPSIRVGEGNTSSDPHKCDRCGAFTLYAPGFPLDGELTDVHLLDIAPTLLSLAGCSIPSSMQGHNLLTDRTSAAPTNRLVSDEEEIIRERLRGLGYI